MKYPRIWENKRSGDRLRVMPWWETITEDGKVEEVDDLGHMIASVAGRPCKFGVLVQVGYLLENVHGIWLGLRPKAVDEFIDLGEPSDKIKPRKKRKSPRRYVK